MSKKIIKNRTEKCGSCGAESGVLTISLPKNVFLRPRTEKESKIWGIKSKARSLTAKDIFTDVQNRRVNLCPVCIKPLQKQFGPENVGGWGQQTKGKKR